MIDLENADNKFIAASLRQLNVFDELINSSLIALKSNKQECIFFYNKIRKEFPHYFWKYKENLNSQFAFANLEKELIGYALDLLKKSLLALDRERKPKDFFKEVIWYLSTLSYVMGVVGATIEKNKNMSVYSKKGLQNSPKQSEKLFIQDCWQEWQSHPLRYKDKSAFATDMLEKSEHLTSLKKITDWCREWEKESSS